MTMKPCLSCEYARWNTTATGRLAPTGVGHCTWTRSIDTPASWLDDGRATLDRLLERTRYINRQQLAPSCKTWVKKENTNEHS